MAGTVIGEGLSIEGELTGDDEVVVHGTVRGTLTTTDAISVGSGGVVEADLTASHRQRRGPRARRHPSWRSAGG